MVSLFSCSFLCCTRYIVGHIFICESCVDASVEQQDAAGQPDLLPVPLLPHPTHTRPCNLLIQVGYHRDHS